MARYIDADVLIEKMTLGEYIFAETPFQKGVNANTEFWISEIKYMPTADVVPKSEVDRLETEIRLLTEKSILAKYPCCVSCGKGLILTKSLEEYDKLLADIASEVAREIFEEIDGITDLFAKGIISELEMYDMIANFKKKYTESGGKV